MAVEFLTKNVLVLSPDFDAFDSPTLAPSEKLFDKCLADSLAAIVGENEHVLEFGGFDGAIGPLKPNPADKIADNLTVGFGYPGLGAALCEGTTEVFGPFG